MNAPAWHEGERALQARAGIAERMAEIGPRVLRHHMPEQHRSFFAQLPFLIAGSLDGEGRPWASVLAAAPGFAHSPDPRHLRIDALPLAGDPLAAALAVGAPLGLLGIEPHTRRRNRMNGTVEALDARGFSVEVGQSFGNCPKYIQAREPVFVGGAPAAGFGPRLEGLDAAARRMVRAADTFFIATAHPSAGNARSPAEGVDVSHRGGRPGFVRVEGQGTLTVPDFTGNTFFNTLGNIALNPMAGLLFVDFETGDLLQLSVKAEVLWDGQEVDAFEGAERLLRMEVLAAQHAPAALPLRFGAASLSPFLEATGRWPDRV
ncbi:pyridoxamine 5'-phosphate oxidase family protein [Variovorax guangxiensis]|uniref:pyridoxamine 5'-phosphate oxidase family protein n=1 Tax=Variovorax guangxiensis TaxID=1775474 RepID=UPI00286790EC|nr:pyridoxamine 5'-phosphate oxidase family protein [Variovorax guangxiensis]MDR6857608.1 putative pyridoxine 5'-phosphate oxidase superfamily flavin-nucleotide-binding protein [Variovorax guangxiensis]